MKHIKVEEVSFSVPPSSLFSVCTPASFSLQKAGRLSCFGVLLIPMPCPKHPGAEVVSPSANLFSEEIADWFTWVRCLAFVQSALSRGGSLCPAAA